MGRRNGRDDAHVRPRDLGEPLNFSWTVGADFDDGDFVRRRSLRRVNGKPTRLLKLPSVLSTLPRNVWPFKTASAKIAAAISLVVVLPLEPVMAITFGRKFLAAIMGQIAQRPECIARHARWWRWGTARL